MVARAKDIQMNVIQSNFNNQQFKANMYSIDQVQIDLHLEFDPFVKVQGLKKITKKTETF